jgi:excisionase family DNA binding protein
VTTEVVAPFPFAARDLHLEIGMPRKTVPLAQDALLTTDQAARILGVARNTLENWRCQNAYPLAYVKIGRRVLYRASDVDAFVRARTVGASE